MLRAHGSRGRHVNRGRSILAGLLLLPAIAVAANGAGPASDEHNQIVIPRVERVSELGTDLSKPPWTQAAVLTGLVDLKCRSMARSTTWFYLAWDDDGLLVAARCEAKGAAATQPATERDGRIWRDDSIEILVAPRDAYFHFVLNAAGGLYDAAGKDGKWNGDIGIRTSKALDGWVAAVRIPFATINAPVPKPGSKWLVNLCRNGVGAEKTAWSPTPRGFTSPEGFGAIVFGARAEPPLRFETIAPVGIGPNSVKVRAGADALCAVSELDGWNQVLTRREAPIAKAGEAMFLRNDQARAIEFRVLDKAGVLLSRSWYPIESPAVSHRLAPARNRFRECQAALNRFPSRSRAEAEKVLKDAEPLLKKASDIVGAPQQYSRENWAALETTITRLEQTLSAAWVYARTLAHKPEAAFGVGFESPMRKVMIRDFPFEGYAGAHGEIALARNEHEGIQIVAVPFDTPLKSVSVSVDQPREVATGKALVGTVTISLVGHVRVVENTPYEVAYRGWYPDPLLGFQKSCDIQPGEQVAFWVDVATQAGTFAGNYVATAVVRAQGCPDVPLELRVRVWDFELPRENHLRNAFTYNEPQVRGFYKGTWTDETARKYYDLILDHRLNVDHLYRREPPDLGLMQYCEQKGLNAFNLVYLSKGATKSGVAKLLDPYIARIKKAGLFDRAYVYGFDEASDDSFAAMREIYSEIHRLYPGLPTMTTAYDNSFGTRTDLGEAVDIWVPLTDQYRVDEARRLRSQGKDMWWYICLNPHHPYANWFIEYPAIEARLLMGAMSYKYEVGGFLYYLISSWENNSHPIDSGPFTKWNPGSCEDRQKRVANGDGCLLYPGPDGPLSCIRLENVRDGIEDYEYLYLLQHLVARARSSSNAADAGVLDQAQTLLSVPEKLVRTLTQYTRDPAELAAWRAEVAASIVKLKPFAR